MAACAGVIARGRLAAASAPPEQAVLDRMIGPIDLQNPTLLQSVTAIGQAGNTRVELSGIDSDFAAMPAESRLALRGVNLHAALRATLKLWRFTEDPPLQLHVSGPVVRIAPASQTPRFMRSYPVSTSNS